MIWTLFACSVLVRTKTNIDLISTDFQTMVSICSIFFSIWCSYAFHNCWSSWILIGRDQLICWNSLNASLRYRADFVVVTKYQVATMVSLKLIISEFFSTFEEAPTLDTPWNLFVSWHYIICTSSSFRDSLLELLRFSSSFHETLGV